MKHLVQSSSLISPRFTSYIYSSSSINPSRSHGGPERTTSTNPFRGAGLQRSSHLFLLFISLLAAVPVNACPSSCVCKWKGGKMTVECVNKGLANLPRGLDHETQVLDFTGNSLVILAREKFKELGLTNLQRIYVSRCKLVQLDDAAFKGLSNLVELDLSHNELIMVPVAAFEHTVSLMRLLLSYNPITKIRDGSFNKLRSLTSLEMTGCDLKVLEGLSFQGLDTLEWLKLNDNHLKTVPQNMALPRKLHGVDLHNNPWHCDCKLKHLMSWLVNYKIPSSIEPKCKTPHRLENQIIKDIRPQSFACPPEVRPTSFFRDVLEGRNVSFECHVVADPAAAIDWRFNGYPLQNSSLAYDESTTFHIYEEGGVSHLRIEMVTEAQDGVFQCAAENTAGRMISNFTLRVSVPPTVAVPKDYIEDNFKYIGVAIAGSVAAVFLLICIIVCKCCHRKKKKRRKRKEKEAEDKDSDKGKEKEICTSPRNSAPKYIQIGGTPTPKANGISNAAPPISVIEASPYRSSPAGAPHPNPDLISDSPVEERAKPKKKVSILGVEEVDSNGVVTTRKLDDIAEEYEDNYVPTFDQPHSKSNDFDSQDSMNPYSNISNCRIIANTNPYPLIDIPSEDYARQNVSISGNRQYEAINFQCDGVPKDDSWIPGNGGNNRGMEYSSIKSVPEHHSPAYATLRRGKITESGPRDHIMHDQKYPEEYQLQATNPSSYQAPDGRYIQNYGLVVEKYHSNGTSPTTASTSLTGCDCCPDQKSCGIVGLTGGQDPAGGRISGDGCSFDSTMMGGGMGGSAPQCCYTEGPHQAHLFNNSLPENYTAIESTNTSLFVPGPLPPEGWRDSDCGGGGGEQCGVKDNNVTPWDCMPLSPSTRILYSPPEEEGGCKVAVDQSRGTIPVQQQSGVGSAGDVLPPATQV